MKKTICGLAILIHGVMQIGYAGYQQWTCQTVDTSSNLLSKVSQMVNVTQPLIVILVDFPDGRKSNGSLPTVDMDTAFVANIDAVGSMGYIMDSTLNPPRLRKKIRKYVYEDYWNMIYSVGTYTGQSHPDYSSHQGYVPPETNEDPYNLTVYGSVRDYWYEVSYGNLQIQAHQTHSGNADMYHTGVVNNIISANGKNYVRWIELDSSKSYYLDANGKMLVDPLQDAVTKVQNLHSLQPSDSNYIAFDINSYPLSGKICVITAGGRLGGWAEGIGGQGCVVPEKMQYWQNTTPSAIFNAIGELAHEFGHTIGFAHFLAGSYDLMFWGGLGLRRHYFSPPHINPLSKIQMGWIPTGNVYKIKTNSPVSLPSITSASPAVALITVYGDAGRDGNYYPHSEYLLIEYRTRNGFNRFAGGPTLTDTSFHGGALIWDYSSFSNFPDSGQILVTGMGLKVQGYGQSFMGNPGNPSHFYPYHGTALDSTTDPNSNSVANLITGLSLNSFSINGGTLNFNVAYQLGTPPQCSTFLYPGAPAQPTTWSGSVYIQGQPIVSGIKVLAGTRVYSAGGNYGSLIVDGKFFADAGANDSIVFDGVGYQSQRLKWGFSQVRCNAGITLVPETSLDTITLRNCVFRNANKALAVQIWNLHRTIQSNRFSQNDTDIVILGDFTNNGVLPDLSGYDNNTFTMMNIWGSWKLASGQQFHIGSSSTLNIRAVAPGYFSEADLSNLNTFQIDGMLNVSGDVRLAGGSTLFNRNFTVPSGSTLTLTSSGTITTGGGIIITVNSGGVLRADQGCKVLFGGGSDLLVSGRLAANGSSSQRITFTSSSATPAPGDWEWILCYGGGPDSLTYCNIKYAQTGLYLWTTAANSFMAYDTISQCSYDGLDVIGTGVANTTLKMYRCGIKNDGGSGMGVGDAKVSITYSRIENNGAWDVNPGVRANMGAYVCIDSSRVQYNVGSGIEVTDQNSRVSLSADEIKPGYNTIYQHGLGEIYVHNSASAFLGYGTRGAFDHCDCSGGEQLSPPIHPLNISPCPPGCTPVYRYTYQGGWNNVFNSFTYNCRLINNETSNIVRAWNTYWGNGGNMFCGSVDATFPLEDSIHTAAKAVFSSRTPETFSITPDIQQFLEWLAQLKMDVLNDSSNAIDALHELALYVGPGGAYPNALQTPWEDFLVQIENSSVPQNLKTVTAAFRVQARMDRGQFADASSLADQLLQQPNISDDMWLFCQTRKVIASVAMADTGGAQMTLNSMYSRGVQIDKKGVEALKFYVDHALGSGNGSTGGLVKLSQKPRTVVPMSYKLEQNYPNPFNPTTRLSYSLPTDAYVVLKVYDVIGREVATLVHGYQEAGFRSAEFNASKFPSGVYFYRLQAGNFSDVKKMLLMK